MRSFTHERFDRETSFDGARDVGTIPLQERSAWRALEAHHADIRDVHLRDLFAADPGRGERLTLGAAGLFLDHSKHRISDETIRLLVELAQESGLRERIGAMFRGDRINVTEDRPALHVALRAPRDARIMVDGENVVPGVHEVLDRMAAFARSVRDGTWRGHSGARIRTSSTSASVAPISGRSWPTRRSAASRTGH